MGTDGTAQHATRASEWLDVIRIVATTRGGVETFLPDDGTCNPLVGAYARCKLAPMCHHLERVLRVWDAGAGDAAAASESLLRAVKELNDLTEMVSEYPIMRLLDIGLDMIANVGIDLIAAGGYADLDTADGDPF